MSFKFVEPSNGKKALRQQIENIKKRKMASKSVVNLSEYRVLQHSGERKTILVVDGDEIMRNAMKRLLEAEDYNVILAEDGLALSKILEHSNRVDLIFLEVNLPWVDGFELCKLVKAHQDFKGVPLILTSGCPNQEYVQKGFEAGCTEYILKPFDANFMTDLVNKTLQCAE